MIYIWFIYTKINHISPFMNKNTYIEVLIYKVLTFIYKHETKASLNELIFFISSVLLFAANNIRFILSYELFIYTFHLARRIPL